MKKRNNYLMMSTQLWVLASLVFIFPAYSQEPWQTVDVWSAIVKGENIDIVKKSLEKGLDPNVIGPSGYPLLQVAVAQNNMQIVKIFLEYGPELKKPGCEWLVKTAIDNGNNEMTKLLIDAGAVISKPKYFCCMWDDPLVTATGKENVEIVLYLLSKGANVNSEGLGLRCPLDEAAAIGNLELMKVLLEAGANINHRDAFGKTPLMYACERGKYASVEFLLSKSAELNLKDAYQRTAEFFAANSSNPDKEKILKLLKK